MSLADLAGALAGGGDEWPFRFGTVTAVTTRNDGGATYTVVTVDGRQMRCLGSYTPGPPAVGHRVFWVWSRSGCVCLGPLL